MVKKIRKKKPASKQKKDAINKMKSLQEDLNSLPESCSYCSIGFDLKKDADTWMVNLYEGQSPILICPKCFKERNR